jgi:hypothetical protein
MKWAEHVASMGKSINASKFLIGRHERKRPLGRPSGRRESNIKADVKERGRGQDSFDLGEDPVVGSCEHDIMKLGVS